MTRTAKSKTIATTVAALVVAAGSAAAAVAQSLPTGTWQMNANGRQRTLTIEEVRPDGTVEARMQNTAEVRDATWDEAARKIEFVRIVDPNRPNLNQRFTGYLLDDDPERYDSRNELAGSFTYRGPAATPRRHVYGWYATMPK